MQSFLPYAGFAESAVVLDPRRLGKQRVEALQILRGLTVERYGWRHHPAVKMWAGQEEALVRYGLEICRAWTKLDRADTCELTLRRDLADACSVRCVRKQVELDVAGDLPPWLGDNALHASHRSALLRKDPAYYGGPFNGPPDLPYVWPSSDREPCRRPG